MDTPVPSAVEGSRTAERLERFLEELRERMPAELLLAAEAPLERSTAGGLDAAAAEELSADPCRFLRRACQRADYEVVAASGSDIEDPGGDR